jgi:hypothetical protein
VKTTWVYKLVKYLKKVYFKNDKRVAAYLVCVAIATGFWFLNALSKTYTVKIVAPVEYYNFPNNKTLANNLPDKFELTIRSHGFTILRRKLIFLLGPLSFNVNEMTNSRMLDIKKNNFALPTRQFLNELSYQLSNDIEILSMTPDTLFFRFGKMTQKRVKIKPVVNVNLKKQFQISGEKSTSPNTVVVSGPQSILDTLQFVYTNPSEFNDVDQSIKAKAEISPVKDLFFDPQWVELMIPVEEYTEAQQSVPVNITDVPANLKVKLFPAQVKVSFLVGLSRFSEIHSEDFKLAVSYTDIENGQQRLRIKSVSVPAFLYDVKITPEEIEYLIEN